ncbi:MAG TPA: serine protease, partial [Pirellulales bacterium]|nr:serine protease [Pirellulales bacterium]
QAGTETRWRQMSRRSRVSMLVACIALLGCGGVYVVAKNWNDIQKLVNKGQADINRQQSEVNIALGKRVDGVVASVNDLAKLTAEQRDALTTFSEKLDHKSSSVNRAAGDIRPSVYLVGIQPDKDSFVPLATAWVADNEGGYLATNAHVAIVHRNVADYNPQLPNDLPLVVRSPGADAKTFEVVEVLIHPGYDEFVDLWDKYDPSRPTGKQTLEPVASAGPACDVALLRVAEKDQLAPNLKLADTKTLDAIAPGEPVGLTGYPLEGISAINVEQPNSESDVGIVKSVTDYFGSPDQGAERLLIHHSVPTAGGASGSPIVNADGEVIAIHNASNLIGYAIADETTREVSNVRIGSPSNIHYAQRVDLVRELLADAAAREARQAQRMKDWEARIAKFYKQGHVLAAQWALDDMTKQFQTELEASGEFTVKQMTLDKPRVESAPDKKSGGVTHQGSLPLPSAGFYLAAALGARGHKVSLVASLDKKEYHGQARSDIESVSRTTLKATTPGVLDMTARAESDDAVQFAVMRFMRVRRSADDLHDALAKRWAAEMKLDVQRVSDVGGTLSKSHDVGDQFVAAGTYRFEPDDAGRYLVTIVGSEQGLLWVTVDGQSYSDKSAARPGTWISTSIDRKRVGPISGMVMCDTEGVGYTMRLYRATDPPKP